MSNKCLLRTSSVIRKVIQALQYSSQSKIGILFSNVLPCISNFVMNLWTTMMNSFWRNGVHDIGMMKLTRRIWWLWIYHVAWSKCAEPGEYIGVFHEDSNNNSDSNRGDFLNEEYAEGATEWTAEGTKEGVGEGVIIGTEDEFHCRKESVTPSVFTTKSLHHFNHWQRTFPNTQNWQICYMNLLSKHKICCVTQNNTRWKVPS